MGTKDNIDFTRLLIGCRDWEHTTWNAAFYPHDLPGDWQLSYYANEIPCVLLPAERWHSCSPGDLAAWQNEVPAGFLFFLESAAGEPQESELGLASALGDALGGLVQRPQISGEVAISMMPQPGSQSIAFAGSRRGVLLLDVEGASLREQRALLEQAAPQFAGFDLVAIILAAPGLLPVQVMDFRRLAELMDFA